MSGRLVYVVGPSGAGKDSVLDYARTRLAVDAGIIFARRFITREPAATGEQHVAVCASGFERLLLQGGFALHWQANGLRYGIGNEIRGWMSVGFHVVVNGSREYLPAARELFPDALVVCITAPADAIRQRLSRRARENAADIDQRMRRAIALTPPSGPDVMTIVNDGDLDIAGTALMQMLATLTPADIDDSAGARR